MKCGVWFGLNSNLTINSVVYLVRNLGWSRGSGAYWRMTHIKANENLYQQPYTEHDCMACRIVEIILQSRF